MAPLVFSPLSFAMKVTKIELCVCVCGWVYARGCVCVCHSILCSNEQPQSCKHSPAHFRPKIIKKKKTQGKKKTWHNNNYMHLVHDSTHSSSVFSDLYELLHSRRVCVWMENDECVAGNRYHLSQQQEVSGDMCLPASFTCMCVTHMRNRLFWSSTAVGRVK